MFVHPTNTTVILDLKRFLSIKNYFYQNQNIAIIIKGESETCPISEIAIIVFSLKFIGSFEAAAISFIGFFYNLAALVCFLAIPLFPLLSSPFCSNSFQIKKRAASKFSPLWAQCETLGLIEDYARKFHQEANGSKLSTCWLAQLSENSVDCVGGWSLFAKQAKFFSAFFSKQFFHQKETLMSYKSKGICSIALKFIHLLILILLIKHWSFKKYFLFLILGNNSSFLFLKFSIIAANASVVSGPWIWWKLKYCCEHVWLPRLMNVLTMKLL